ncbi:MAG: flagellar biosynthetic protein FliO [Halothiobacillus sp. 20-53-49]|nr:MAG: flagellar biosynthetic protein FliO [Halothiobacillus sp. 20-53-49]
MTHFMRSINGLNGRTLQPVRWISAVNARCCVFIFLMLWGGAVFASEPLPTPAPNSAPVPLPTPGEPLVPSPVIATQPVPFEFSPAQPPKANKAPPEPAAFDPLSTAYLLKLVSSLMLVLALMFAVVWILKRTGRFSGRAGRYPLQVLTQMPLGTRERVLLIAVGDRQMLIGVAPGQVTALGWVDPPLATDASPPTLHPDAPFTRLLQQYLGQKNKAPSSPDPRATEPQP